MEAYLQSYSRLLVLRMDIIWACVQELRKMEMIHHKRRVDGNQLVIVKALRKIGCCVIDLSGSGGGVMDIVVCLRGKIWLCEIKNPTKPKSGQCLTPAQIEMHRAIADAGCEVHIIRNFDDFLALVYV